MTLCYSHRTLVMAFPSQRQEAFLAGHEAAFRFFGGVPHRISDDNRTTALQIRLRGRTRPAQATFPAFRSHYLFTAHLCTPEEPQEKCRVEHRVGFSRRNSFVPRPQVATYADLNAHSTPAVSAMMSASCMASPSPLAPSGSRNSRSSAPCPRTPWTTP